MHLLQGLRLPAVGTYQGSSGQEIQLIWGSPRCTGVYLFYINRYFAFFANVAYIGLEFAGLQGKVSVIFYLFTFLFVLLYQA